MNTIEARPYGPEISDSERDVLRAQVTLMDENIISWQEAPVTTPYQLEVYAEKLRELIKDLDGFYLLADLSNTIRPSPEVLDCLRSIMSGQKKLRHAAVFTGMNPLINVAAKFVLARIGFASFSIHKTRDQALDAIKNARG